LCVADEAGGGGPRGHGGPQKDQKRSANPDFLDFATDEKGATAKLTDTLFAKLLEEDAPVLSARADPLGSVGTH
jgi:hypothetical protein